MTGRQQLAAGGRRPPAAPRRAGRPGRSPACPAPRAAPGPRPAGRARRARASCCPAGTTSCTSPIRWASAAPSSSPVSSQRMALPQPELLRRPHGRPAERQDAAPDLELAEADVVGGDDDVAGQRQLDRQREGDALHGQHHGLGHRRAPQPERVVLARSPTARRGRPAATAGSTSARSRPAREVVAVAEDDAAAGVRAGELVVGRADLVDDLQVPGVALGRTVDADEQDVAVAVHGHEGRRSSGESGSRPAGRHPLPPQERVREAGRLGVPEPPRRPPRRRPGRSRAAPRRGPGAPRRRAPGRTSPRRPAAGAATARDRCSAAATAPADGTRPGVRRTASRTWPARPLAGPPALDQRAALRLGGRGGQLVGLRQREVEHGRVEHRLVDRRAEGGGDAEQLAATARGPRAAGRRTASRASGMPPGELDDQRAQPGEVAGGHPVADVGGHAGVVERQPQLAGVLLHAQAAEGERQVDEPRADVERARGRSGCWRARSPRCRTSSRGSGCRPRAAAPGRGRRPAGPGRRRAPARR